MDQVIAMVGCSDSYSFTSSHAANHTALSFFLFLTLFAAKPFWKWTFMIWAVSIGFGQIYVGLHFPLDVVGGTIIGLTTGGLAGYGLNRWMKSSPMANNL